jgi:two-component system alkaline phosphatase synthesis response regulator PhoP
MANEKKGKKILMIDDDENLQEMLRVILEANGYECCSFYDSTEIISRIEEIKPDLVICDIELPGLSGYKLARLLKKMNKNLPVIILTGMKTEPIEQQLGIESGVDEYIVKSLEVDKLVTRINELIAQYESRTT